MTIFFKEVLCTHSFNDLVAVEELLKNNQITYKRKSANRNFYGLNNRRTILGTVGERLELETQYYLYVSPKDEETAEYLIREWKRQ